MKDHYEEEVASKENIGRQLNKALGEADMLRVKYEKEGLAKAEELEMAKLKMQARLSEAESTSMQLQAKLAQIEKARAKLAADLEAQAQQLDQAQILNGAMEKKAKQFDRWLCTLIKSFSGPISKNHISNIQDCWRVEGQGR